MQWENKFPGLNDPWTHWWIEGDGNFIDIISVDQLGAAINVIKNNWQKYSSIKTSQAKYKQDGTITRDDQHNVVIYSEFSHRNIEEV